MKLKSRSPTPSLESFSDQGVLKTAASGRITPDDSIRTAGAKLCSMNLYILRIDTIGAIKGEDAEYVHRMHIAARKLRIILRLWEPYLDKQKTVRLRGEIKRLAGKLGSVRDTDILEKRFKTRLECGSFSGKFKEYITRELLQRGTAGRKTLVTMLSSGRYEKLLASIEHLFDEKPLSAENTVLRNIVPRFFSFAIKKADVYAGRILDNKELHSLRIAFKRLRYIAEFFGDCYPGKLSGSLRQFKKYQQVLGKYCDARVAEAFLTTLVPDEKPATPEAWQRCMELGGLILLERIDAEEQKRRFEEKTAALPKLLTLVRKETKRI